MFDGGVLSWRFVINFNYSGVDLQRVGEQSSFGPALL
jgi:hypothetical protein